MFKLIRGGCFARHCAGFHMNRPNGLPHYLFLVIKSYSQIYIYGRLHTCKPDSVIIIKPYTPYSYNNPNGEYIDDWLHFSCDFEDIKDLPKAMFNHSFPIQNAGLITTYIQQLLWENNYTKDSAKDYYVDTIFRIILRHTYDDFNCEKITEYTPYHFKLHTLRLSIQAEPYKKYIAKDIATHIGISTSYFQSLYKKVFGISFQADIINMRIDYSKELIVSTSMTIEEIAYICGYSNEVHFYRQFSTKTGLTPGQYRINYSKK